MGGLLALLTGIVRWQKRRYSWVILVLKVLILQSRTCPAQSEDVDPIRRFSGGSKGLWVWKTSTQSRKTRDVICVYLYLFVLVFLLFRLYFPPFDPEGILMQSRLLHPAAKCRDLICVRHAILPFFDAVCVFAERSGGHVDHFDIAERVEMGQMASMFFNKGNYSCRPQLLISLPIISITCRRRRHQPTCNVHGGGVKVVWDESENSDRLSRSQRNAAGSFDWV